MNVGTSVGGQPLSAVPFPVVFLPILSVLLMLVLLLRLLVLLLLFENEVLFFFRGQVSPSFALRGSGRVGSERNKRNKRSRSRGRPTVNKVRKQQTVAPAFGYHKERGKQKMPPLL